MGISELIATGALIISMLAYLQSASALRKQGTIFNLELKLKLYQDELTGLHNFSIGRAHNVGQAPIKLEMMILKYFDNKEEIHHFITQKNEDSNCLDMKVCREDYMDDYYYGGDSYHKLYAEFFELKQNEGKEIFVDCFAPLERVIKEIQIFDVTGKVYRVKGLKKAYKTIKKISYGS